MTTEAEDRPVILWFRQDLRLADNPALVHAVGTGRPILPLFILDQGSSLPRPALHPCGGSTNPCARWTPRYARAAPA